jgi:ATP-dependent Clp protease ATP-binding subunit ClpB
LSLIVDIQLGQVEKMLKDRKLTLQVTPAAKERLIAEGYDPQYGARPMRRAIQRLIQDPLALKLIQGDFMEGDTILVDVGPTENELLFTKLVPVTA